VFFFFLLNFLPYRWKILETPASTTALHDARNTDLRAPLHYTVKTSVSTTALHDARNAGEHHSLSSPPASTGGRHEDVPPVLQHPIDETLQNKVKKEREKQYFNEK
jgi:hypothetical protein